MIIGIPKEVKTREYRVGATPASVRGFCEAGHKVWVEVDAGRAIGYLNEDYQKAGGEIKEDAKEVWRAEMVLKVKEPQKSEYPLLREGQILFCFLHLAAELDLTKRLMEEKVVAIAFETVKNQEGRLPLLVPMSEIAGRLSIEVGGWALQVPQGGKGLLLGGVPGVRDARVMVLGGGTAGTEAARRALGAGANVTLLDNNLARLSKLDLLFGPSLKTLYASKSAIEEVLCRADLMIGAVLIPGKSAPKLVERSILKKMEPGSVIVDISIDQGGCVETSRPTTHDHPTFSVDGIIHYCVANMPSAVAKTATEALANATSDYVLFLANHGWKEALFMSPELKAGLNVCSGKVTAKEVAEDLNLEYVPADSYLGQER